MDTAALRELPIVCPDRDSTTQFAPFVDVDAKTWVALLDECDRLRAERDQAQEGWDVFAARMHGAEARAARYEQALREIAREYERWDDADREHPWDDVRAAWNAITTAKAALAAGSGEEQR